MSQITDFSKQTYPEGIKCTAELIWPHLQGFSFSCKSDEESSLYRVLHNSLPFLFSKIFVWSCLLWLSVTLSPSTVQQMRADMTPVWPSTSYFARWKCCCWSCSASPQSHLAICNSYTFKMNKQSKNKLLRVYKWYIASQHCIWHLEL